MAEEGGSGADYDGGSDAGSMTQWIGARKAGDSTAAQALWERFFDRLVRPAADRLRGAPGSSARPGRGKSSE